jgi:hypothetical protein
MLLYRIEQVVRLVREEDEADMSPLFSGQQRLFGKVRGEMTISLRAPISVGWHRPFAENGKDSASGCRNRLLG